MSDLVSALLAKLEQVEAELNERARDPYEGLSDDELHDRRAHPAYEYAMTEGQRKAWDDVDTPPRDPETGKPEAGWELNITSSDDEAFERFDYHEERYWRRLRPDGPRERTIPQDVIDGLRLCRAHRDIVEQCQAILAVKGWEYSDAPNLAQMVLDDLAAGLGVEETTDE